MEEHLAVGTVVELGEGSVAVLAAVVAHQAEGSGVLAKVAEEHAAAALVFRQGIFLHGLDALGVALLALFVDGRSDDDAVGIDTLASEGDRGTGAAGYIMYHARATQSEQGFVEGLEIDAAHLADELLVDEHVVAEDAAIEAQKGADEGVGVVTVVAAAV